MRNLLSLFIIVCMSLSSCSLLSPLGSVKVVYDSTEKTEDWQVVDSDGNVTKLSTKDFKASVDKLLEGVDLPSGSSVEDLKAFVYNGLESAGIDLDNLVTEEDVQKAEETLKSTLEEAGVDTSDINIDLGEGE